MNWDENTNEDISTITFTLNDDGANAEALCTMLELAQFLGNIIPIAREMIDGSDIPAEVRDVIYEAWQRHVKDLPTNDEEGAC